jgi:hypothetical protein
MLGIEVFGLGRAQMNYHWAQINVGNLVAPLDDPKIADWYLNPTFDRSFHGPGVSQSMVFSPNFKFSYEFAPKISGGLEYYGSMGRVTGFDPLSQQHQIIPVVDLNLAPQWEINFGVGIGVTRSTDQLIAKMILGYRFNSCAGTAPRNFNGHSYALLSTIRAEQSHRPPGMELQNGSTPFGHDVESCCPGDSASEERCF